MPCPDPETLARYADAQLAPEAVEAMRAHVDECQACREVLVTLVRSSQASPGSSPDVPWDVPLAGSTLGRYRVTGTRGAGGMGVVVAAYDPQLDRQVALKLLRPDATTDDAAARHRLVREAQLMARIRHPNVVTVHDVVVEGERVFIAMALVDGVTVRDWLEQGPRTEAEIVRVFLEAGRGLAAAHRAGVVHRDFKPDNVLVDATGQVLVSDFGLAWSRALPVQTSPGGVPADLSSSASAPIGTPAYMAPEQLALGAVDARADQFSFCVALFEALHGRRPFETATRSELLAAITTGRIPEGPRSISRSLGKALVRGLSADPTKRFPSMEALLDALVPRTHSSRRWPLVALATALVLVPGAGLWLRNARADCAGFELRLRQAFDADRKAALASRLTQERAAPLISRLEALSKGLSVAWAENCAAPTPSQRTVLTCLTQRTEQLELTTEVLAQPTTEARAAQALVTRLDDERACLAGELLTIVPKPPAAGVAALVHSARLHALTADALRLAGKPDDAKASAEQAVEVARKTGWRPAEAEAFLAKAQALRARGAFAEAESTLTDALLAAEAGRHFEAIARIAVQHILVIGTQSMRPADAEPWVRRADAALEQLPRPRLRAEVDVATTMLRVAQGDLTAGLTVSERALAWTSGNDALSTADVRNLRAQLFLQHGRHREALDEARAAATLRSDLLGRTHPLALHARVTYGDALARSGLAADAKSSLTEALDDVRQRKDVSPMTAATGLVALGLALELRGEFAEALVSTKQAVELVESVFGPNHRYSALAHRNLGERLRAMGRFDESVDSLTHAVQLGDRSVGPHHRETLESRAALALTLAVSGRPGANEQARPVLDEVRGDSSIGEAPAVIAALALATAPAASKEARAQAVDLARRVRGVPHPDVIRALLLQRRAGDLDAQTAGTIANLQGQLQVVEDWYEPSTSAVTTSPP
jgi:tetratricopeptide (TPR) repeat protein